MSPQKLVLLTSDNGVVLAKVTLAQGSPAGEPISTYVVEIGRTKETKAFEKRTDALECFEIEVERATAG